MVNSCVGYVYMTMGGHEKFEKLFVPIMSVIKHEITCMKSTCYATVYTYNPNHLISLERERRHMNSVSSLATIDYSIVLPHCIY